MKDDDDREAGGVLVRFISHDPRQPELHYRCIPDDDGAIKAEWTGNKCILTRKT